jgi:hypothetical protein
MPRRARYRLDDFEAGADLQDQGGIHDVLRGRAPMHIAAGVAALFCHLVHQRQDRIADDIGLAAQQIEIEGTDVGTPSDFFGRSAGITPQRASALASAISTSA